MNKIIEKELKNRYTEVCFDDGYNKLINLVYKLLKSVPRPQNCDTSALDKEQFLNYLYLKFLDYSEQAFYNLVLGNYEFYRAGLRILVENYIIILGIIKGDDTVCQRYFLQSYLSTANLLKNDKNTDDINYIKTLIDDQKKKFNLLDFHIEEKKFNYSWLSTKDREIYTFKQACDLLDPSAYKEFKLLSNYSHSNSFTFKLFPIGFLAASSVSVHVLYLMKVISILNFDVSDDYIKAIDEIWKYLDILKEQM